MRLLLILLLAGCATTGQVPKETLVPVIKPCVTNPPVKPALRSDAEITAMDDYAATLTAWTERLLLKAYAEKADGALQACR